MCPFSYQATLFTEDCRPHLLEHKRQYKVEAMTEAVVYECCDSIYHLASTPVVLSVGICTSILYCNDSGIKCCTVISHQIVERRVFCFVLYCFVFFVCLLELGINLGLCM